MTLTWTTTLLGLLSVALTALINRRLITPALFYWIGWWFAVWSAESIGGDPFLPAVGERTVELVTTLHLAAVAGFLMGAVLGRLHAEATDPLYPEDHRTGERLILDRNFVRALFVAHAVTGFVALAHRASEMGGFAMLLDIGAVRASFLQAAYLKPELPLPIRLMSHLSLFLSVVPFLFAIQDALNHEIRWGRFGLWWLLSVPGGISSGGRGWVLAAPLAYFATHVSVGGVPLLREIARRYGIRLLLVPAIIIALFSSLQFMRVGDDAEHLFGSGGDRWHDRFNEVKPVLYYLAMPTLAIEEYAEFVERRERTHGGLVAPFAAAQLQRFRFIDDNPEFEFARAGRARALLSPTPILGVTHSTIVPRLIGDFGPGYWAVAFVLMSAIIQYAFLRLYRVGILRRMIAAQLLLYGGFWVAQDLYLLSAGAILPVLALALILAVDRFLHDSGVTAGRGLLVTTGPVADVPRGAQAARPAMGTA